MATRFAHHYGNRWGFCTRLILESEHLAPFYVDEAPLRPVDDAPVRAVAQGPAACTRDNLAALTCV